MVKQKKRGISKDTQEDLLLSAAIKAGKSGSQQAALRTKHQSELFEAFKTGIWAYCVFNAIYQSLAHKLKYHASKIQTTARDNLPLQFFNCHTSLLRICK
jgi:hypothetical protein